MITDTNTMAGRALRPPGAVDCRTGGRRADVELAAAVTLGEIKKRGYLVMVTEEDFHPFEYIQDGKPVGYDNELIENLRKFLPFEIKQEIIPCTGLLASEQRQVRHRNHRRYHH